ncbi:hypothetical protein CANCADRAFT_104683 [Tortispora caseinolytica NRRL Y-17796]|uniref:Uncharacterized protein n=1 Tax=Tortispora caseinolytica NRRL Y-17796 TaxID=767744 RepID=A0A1E4TF23_9ASCO|nr:hypothetical protein CANCADRAFT_104683 [Tortispora caseinolytica NRRL Y-17796]
MTKTLSGSQNESIFNCVAAKLKNRSADSAIQQEDVFRAIRNSVISIRRRPPSYMLHVQPHFEKISLIRTDLIAFYAAEYILSIVSAVGEYARDMTAHMFFYP